MSFLSNTLNAAVIFATTGNPYLAAAAFASSTYAESEAKDRLRAQKRAANAAQRDRAVQVASGVEPVRIVYGRALTSGPLAVFETSGSKKEFLHRCTVLAGHEIDAVETVYFNETALPAADHTTGLIGSGDFCAGNTETRIAQSLLGASLPVNIPLTVAVGETETIALVAERIDLGNGDAGGGITTEEVAYTYNSTTKVVTVTGGSGSSSSQYLVNYKVFVPQPRVRVRTVLGAAGQAAFSELVSECPTAWTSADTFAGLPVLYTREEYDVDVYGQIGRTEQRCVVRGAKVRDPRANLLQQSNTFGTAPWAATGLTLTANAATSPEGLATATRLTESAVTSAHQLAGTAISCTSGSTYHLCVYAKQGSATGLQLAFGTATHGANAWAAFDLAAGTVGTVGSAATASIQALGSGWYRLKLKAVATATASGAPLLCLNNSGTATGRAPSYAGSTGRNLFVFGASANAGTLPSGYTATTTTAVAAGTRWSANAALCVADYLRRAFGAVDAELPDDELGEAAWVCDQPVQIDGSGTTQPRYTVGVTLSTAEAPRDNLDKLTEAMAGDALYVQGRWLIRAGSYRPAEWTLTDDMLAGDGISIQTGVPRSELYNRATVQYVEPAKVWTQVAAPDVTNSAYVTADGGQDLPLQITLEACTDSLRAQRLAALALQRSRNGLSLQLTCNLKAYDVGVTDIVTFPASRYGLTGEFEVISREFDPLSMTLKLGLKQWSLSQWAWSYTGATAVDTSPVSTLPNPLTRPTAPASLTAASGTAQLLRAPDGALITRVLLTWTASADGFVASGGRVEIQWRPAHESAWQTLAPVDGAQTQAYISPAPEVGYVIVRARFVNKLLRTSDWSTITHLVVGKSAPPSDVTNFSSTVLAGQILLSWDKPTDIDWLNTELRLGSSWASSTLLWVGTAPQYAWAWPDAGTYTLLARHRDTSGNLSAATAVMPVLVNGDGTIERGVTSWLTGSGAVATWSYSSGTAYWTLPAEVYLVDTPQVTDNAATDVLTYSEAGPVRMPGHGGTTTPTLLTFTVPRECRVQVTVGFEAEVSGGSIWSGTNSYRAVVIESDASGVTTFDVHLAPSKPLDSARSKYVDVLTAIVQPGRVISAGLSGLEADTVTVYNIDTRVEVIKA